MLWANDYLSLGLTVLYDEGDRLDFNPLTSSDKPLRLFILGQRGGGEGAEERLGHEGAPSSPKFTV